jgi:hypothetical protein
MTASERLRTRRPSLTKGCKKKEEEKKKSMEKQENHDDDQHRTNIPAYCRPSTSLAVTP